VDDAAALAVLNGDLSRPGGPAPSDDSRRPITALEAALKKNSRQGTEPRRQSRYNPKPGWVPTS